MSGEGRPGRPCPGDAVRPGSLLGPASMGRVPSPGAMPAGCRFQPRCPYAIEMCRERQVMIELGPSRRANCCRAEAMTLPGAVN